MNTEVDVEKAVSRLKEKPTWKLADSWYNPELDLTPEQIGYVNMIVNTFNMKTETGKPIPYNPTKYQVEFHAESLNVMQKHAKDILFIKARGVSFTMCSCIELIVSALVFRNQVFPIIAQRYDSAKGILSVCRWLIENANIDLSNEVEFFETEIKFKRTKSVIRPYPSGSASDAVRSLRLTRAMIDEYAFQSKDKELLAAVQDAMIGELGQIMIGSTPCGVANHFYELVKMPTGFKVFRLPAFDENKIDLNVPLIGQKVKSIAPWIDLVKLEIKRARDLPIFKQENMCSFMDDSISFISLSLIKKCEVANLKNYYNTIETKPDFVYDSKNPMFMGVDVARIHDLTAITIFEKIYNDEGNFNMVQRYIHFIKDKDLPTQQKIIERLLEQFPQIIKVRVDMTGIGLGLYEYLRKKKGSVIEGINFAQRVRTAGYKMTTSIIERMAVNLKNLMQDGCVNLIVDDLQEKHLNDVDYNFKATRRTGEGHGDMFFAVALALLPENYMNPAINPLTIHQPKATDKLPVLEVQEINEVKENLNKRTWEDVWKHYRK